MSRLVVSCPLVFDVSCPVLPSLVLSVVSVLLVVGRAFEAGVGGGVNPSPKGEGVVGRGKKTR